MKSSTQPPLGTTRATRLSIGVVMTAAVGCAVLAALGLLANWLMS